MIRREKFFLGDCVQLIDINKFMNEYTDSEWVNAYNTTGDTPLHIAARKNLQQFKLMLPYFTNIEATSRNGNTVLHILADHSMDFQGNYTKQCISVLQTLIAKRANVNRRNKNGWTAVHYAAERCNIEMLKFLKKSGASFDIRSIEDETPLILACKYMTENRNTLLEAKTIDFLINNDQDINFTSLKGYTALHYAVKKCSKKTVIMLLKRGANPNIRTRDRGLTPLHCALKKGNNLSVVDSLIKAGASLKPSETEELSPLHISLLEGSAEVVDYLIELDADVNYPDRILQFAPLHLTIYQQRYDLFELLLSAGAHLNGCSKDSLTPLHISSILGRAQFTKTLIFLGANVNSVYDDDLTPLHMTSLATNTLDLDMLKKADTVINFKKKSFIEKIFSCPPDRNLKEYENVIEFLLSNGADVNALTKSGQSSLHFAAKSDYHTTHFLKILLDYGANVDIREPSSGYTALHFATANNYGNNFGTAVQVLINAGADVNASALDGKKPIHLALEKKFKDVVRVLINAAADVNALTTDGRSPLHLALEADFTEVLQALIQAGANVNCKDPREQLTPLHMALRKNNRTVAAMLIKAGAEANVLTERGKSPIHLDLQSPSFKDGCLEFTEVLKLLISCGGDVNYIEPGSRLMPLHIALMKKYKRAAEMLINAGADVDAGTPDGKRPIHFATTFDDIMVLKLLVGRGANVNCKEYRSQLTPLHMALDKNNQDAAIVLINAGADVNASTPNGKSPMHLALESNCQKVVKALAPCGAKLNCKWKRCMNKFLYMHLFSEDVNVSKVLREFCQTSIFLAIDNIENEEIKRAAILLSLVADARNQNGCIPAVDFLFLSDHDENREFLRKEYGVNINDLDAYWRFMTDRVLGGDFLTFFSGKVINKTGPEYLKKYLSKLKAAKLPLSDNYRIIRTRMPEFFTSTDENIYYKQCLDEVWRLQIYRTINRVTLYKLLYMEPRCLRFYTKNLDFNHIKQKFPIYHKLLLARCREDVIKRALMETAQLALYQMTNTLVPIPCIEKIFFDINVMNIITIILAAELVY